MKRRTIWLLALLFLLGLGWWKFGSDFHPFPRTAQLERGKLGFEARRFLVGDFLVHWQGRSLRSAQLKITHKSEPTRSLWHSIAGQSFVGAARGRATVHESRGSFTIKDRLLEQCDAQRIDRFESGDNKLTIHGTLRCSQLSKPLHYQLRIFATAKVRAKPRSQPTTQQAKAQQDTALRRHLHLSLVVADKRYNRTYLRYASHPKEHFFGFGEQFTHFDVKGRRLPIFVMEQGIGRGAQPITWGANLMAGAGGDWHTSYAGVPHYITSTMRSLFLENQEYSVFDLRQAKMAQVMVFSHHLRSRVLYGRNPLDLIEAYTAYSGRMRKLPHWIHEGAIIGMQGGTKKVRRILKKLQSQKTPIAAFWLQDWVGQRKTSFGKQLWWNWELDRNHYPGWEALRDDLRKVGSRVMLYINPFLADVKDKPKHKRNLFVEAQKQGHLIKNKRGETYMIRNTSFSAALVDLTRPQTRTWMRQIIKKQMIDIGASGWMADFGEALPYDATLHKGSPVQVHNQYPELWAEVNRNTIKAEPNSDEFVFFMRAGYSQSPGQSTLFWLGDQLVSWDRYDGIKTAVTGLVSSGISGFSLNHSDIGGYTTITNILKNYHRSQELHMRWTELSAFNVIFRTHEGNRPDKNHQFHDAPKTLAHFSRFAKIYKAWAPYRKQLVQEATERGWPVVRHPVLHYPKETGFYSMDSQQFMVGDAWMVRPVLDAGRSKVQVLLPPGRWHHLWTNKVYGSPTKSQRFEIEAQVGKPAVFFRAGHLPSLAFRQKLAAQKLLH